MNCIKCGKEHDSEAKFCQSCGSDFSISNDTTAIVSMSPLSLPKEDDTIIGLILNNRFQIIKKLGEGGMGHIYLAEDTKLRRKVAIKSITASKSNDPSTKARFLREAQVVSQLDHSNICTIYEIFEENESDYFVMQYIDGVTLSQITNAGPLSLAKILDIALQICSAMEEAHNKKIVHRDIKPTNIMIDRRGTVKVLDFGLAKPKEKFLRADDCEISMKPTEKGVVLGTVPYMSPEQARGEDLDFQSDIFSFGTVLFECIEGRHPFAGKGPIETLYSILNKSIELSNQVPISLQKIITRAMAKDKANRYTSFQELAVAIKSFQSEQELQNVHTPAETQVIEQHSRPPETQTSQELSEIVKGIKGSATHPVLHVPSRRSLKKHLLWMFPVLMVIVSFSYYMTAILGDRTPSNITTIFISDFENKTEDPEISEIVRLLLVESLGQFESFRVLTRQNFGKLNQEMLESHRIQYNLKGVISHQNNYSIDADLIPLGDKEDVRRIPTTGKDKNSFLEKQIDFIAKDLYFKIKGKNPDLLKKTSDTYGFIWEDVTTLSAGLKSFAMFETETAIKRLQEVEHILVSKYYLADLYYFNGERDVALKYINAVMPQLDVLTNAMQLRVQALKARIEFNFLGQKQYLTELQKLSPFSVSVFYELGEAHFHMGKAQEAIPFYLKALELDSQYSKAINHLGYCYSYLGEHQTAIEHFQEYRRYDQTANAYDSLGDGYFFQGDLSQSLLFKEAAINEAKQNVPWAYLTLADIYVLQARFEKARSNLEAYQNCVKSNSADAEATKRLAYIQFINHQSSPQQLEDALELIDTSLELNDSEQINNDTAEAHWIRGLITLALNQMVESETELKWLKAFAAKYQLSSENFSPPLKYYLHLEALLFEKTGNIDGAVSRFNELMSMKPQLSYWITYFNYPFFQSEYSSFLFRNGMYSQCQKEIRECLAYNPNYPPALWVEFMLADKEGSIEAKNSLIKIQNQYGPSDEENDLRSKLKEALDL